MRYAELIKIIKVDLVPEKLNVFVLGPYALVLLPVGRWHLRCVRATMHWYVN